MRYFIELAYKGTHFHGWQRQQNVTTIQESVEAALSSLCKEKVSCYGCGRTDAGVHAEQFFAQVDIDRPFPPNFIFKINKILLDDIVIHRYFEVSDDTHVRYSAISRSYIYKIHRFPDPFLAEQSSYYDMSEWDLSLMRRATEELMNYTDFRSFCKQADLYQHTKCHILNSELNIYSDKTSIEFRITANRFLRSMVRLLVGNLIELAKGNISYDQWEAYLMTHDKPRFYNLAHPQGLYLSQVSYPFN